MTKRFWIGLALVLAIPGLMFAASCAKRKIECGPEWAPAVEEEAEPKRLAAPPKVVEEQPVPEEKAAIEEFPKEDVYFEFDKSRLLREAQDNLRAKAKWLMAHPDVSAIIEGHCDERGTNEYNMALGDRRAGSAETFLVDLGIGPSRLSTISYGEEKPFDPSHDEEAWAKNRRVHFVIE
jgi:peptidoglycan-associated lipoprotein